MSTATPPLIRWGRELFALATNGLAFAATPFDTERYGRIRDIATEMLAAAFDVDVERLATLVANDVGYQTPKIDVRAAVIRDGRILLVRELSDGLWTLPGGWADVGDSPSSAVVKEVRQESGFDVVATKLYAVIDRDKHEHPPVPFHSYKLFFLCDVIGGQSRPSIETDAADFFPPTDLPPLSLTRVLPWQIELAFHHRDDPALPTRFD